MNYTPSWKLMAAIGLFVFSAGICSYAENKATVAKELSLQGQKTSETKVENVSDDTEETSLMALDGRPLNEDDFIINNVRMGDDPELVIRLNGPPDMISQGTVSDEYHWEKAGLTVAANRKLPYAYAQRKDIQLKNKITSSGISQFYVEGKETVTQRGIAVGSLRENMLRAYGMPKKVLWDGADKSFHFVYKVGQKEIKFIIKENRVKAFQFSVDGTRGKRAVSQMLTENGKEEKILSDEDFGIAGFKLDTKFEAHSWDTWQRKLSNPKEDVWYFSGYAVRATAKSGIIQGLFLTDSNMVTTRGITLGDDLGTVELVYGAPHKVELDISSGHPRTSYIYFSKTKRNILILFFTKQKVDGIVSAKNPQFSGKK